MSINLRDSMSFMVCVGCWKPLPDTEVSEAVGCGPTVKCCGRTYEPFFVVREGREEFRQGYRLTHDEDGPIPEDGGSRQVPEAG